MNKNELHQQNTDLQILDCLIPYIKLRSFLDIGAEKGTFAQFFIDHHLTGVCFEPLPQHAALLKTTVDQSKCLVSEFAISDRDTIADFHIACDNQGNPLDYFHSLHKLTEDPRVHHNQEIAVQCRSLNSLVEEKIIDAQVGILKTDTEGNDLSVLRGASLLKPEVIICEFFMPGIYAGWEQGNPYQLIHEAKKMGFQHCIAIKRLEGFETVTFNTQYFVDKEWGNLIFLNDELFQSALLSLLDIMALKQTEATVAAAELTRAMHKEQTMLYATCEERLNIIRKLENDLQLAKQ